MYRPEFGQSIVWKTYAQYYSNFSHRISQNVTERIINLLLILKFCDLGKCSRNKLILTQVKHTCIPTISNYTGRKLNFLLLELAEDSLKCSAGEGRILGGGAGR